MTIFDQRNQNVEYQYNSAGNINFGSVQNRESLLIELRKLRAEFDKAISAGVLNNKVAVEVTNKLDKALTEASESRPSKKTVENYLKEAKALIEGVTSVTGLITALVQAINLVGRFL